MKNLHYFVTEVHNVKNSMFPDIMRDIVHFQENENNTLRTGTHLASKSSIVWERDGIKLRKQNIAAIATGI